MRSIVRDQQQQIGELTDLVNQLLTRPADQTSIQELELKRTAELSQNRPNPFHENTIIDYFLPAGSENARLEVFNLNGRLLTTLPLAQTGAGQVQLKAGRFPAGIYLYSLIVDEQTVATKRMVPTK